MKRKSTVLTALLLSWLLTGTAIAQDISEQHNLEPRNAISLTVLPLAGRTLSISYARKLKHGREIIFNPRVQVASPDVTSEPAIDKGSNKRFIFLVQDPQWFYNHYTLRVGLRMLLGAGGAGYEPQLQVGYGAFHNKVIKTEDSNGDAYDLYTRLDRKYYSAGIINALSWVLDRERVRVKFFVGMGAHLRQYQDTQWARYVWHREISHDPEPHTYYKPKFTFHGGIEIGLRY